MKPVHAKQLLTRLAKARLELDLTYNELAARIGVTDSTVHRLITTGRPRLTQRTAHKIRKFLDQRRHAA